MGIFGSAPYKDINNTTTETSFFGTAPTIPANFMVAGTVFRIWGYGIYGTAIAAPTLRIKVKLGSVLLIDSGAQLMSANEAGRTWHFSASVNCKTPGSSGAVLASGIALFMTSVTAVNALELTAGTAIADTTIANVIDVTAQWGTASTSNDLQVTATVIEYLPTP